MEKQLTLFGIEQQQQQQQQRSRREVFEDYDGFVDKFKAKLTTDDCYTPEPVYRAILDFVGTLTDLSGRTVVRPFYPGGDFVNYEYPADAIVVDNPPFSILSQIIRFYCQNDIQFFIFAPSLTLFAARDCDVTYIVAAAGITYENGAVVETGFITNLPLEERIWCCTELHDAIEAAQAKPDKTKKGFVYPDNIVTAATLGKLVKHSTELKIRKRSCYPISDSDSAKAAGRSLFGGGFILSDGAAAERAAAERAAAERAAATRLHLSPREQRIIKHLNETEL
jgi:hypothetical protein